jgi:hypothetical protein
MLNGMITNKYGSRAWYQNGQLHRTDGPAVEYADGSKCWCQNNQLHRTNGPAIEFASGAKAWYVKGVQYDLNDWLNLVDTSEVQKTLMRLQYA